ncbi:MAG: hypothetical protein R3E79_41165 [Caldilineaceae bacterium]
MGYKFFLSTLLLCLCTLGITVYHAATADVASQSAIPTALSALPTTTPPDPTAPPRGVEQTAMLAMAPFTVTFPTSWSLLRPTQSEWDTQVATVQQVQPVLAADLDAILAMADQATAIALAWPPAEQPDISLRAAVVPADDLTLSTYLAAARAALETAPPVEGVPIAIKDVGIRYDLHQEQLPVAVLHYEISGEKITEEAPTTGYQAVLLDSTGAHLLLLTFTVRSAEPDAALTLVESIVAAIQQN